MPKIHSLYENLHVARNAPESVVRAAYRALAQQYHPDRHTGDHEAERIMVLLNEAYRILGNPDLRREHDAWIAEKETSSSKIQDEHEKNENLAKQSNRTQNATDAQDTKHRPASHETGKQQVTLDQEYSIFKRKLPYYFLNTVALAIIALILWATTR